MMVSKAMVAPVRGPQYFRLLLQLRYGRLHCT
jgi:hypothetical protein